MSTSQRHCEQIEMLISADLDGELNFDESTRIKTHLSGCKSCAQVRANYLQINRSIDDLGATDAGRHLLDQPSVNELTSSTNWVWRLVPFGLAASLVIAFGFMLVPSQPTPVNAQEIVRPFADVVEINQQAERDQQIMLKTLELELRSLRLELAQITQQDDRGAKLDARLMELINKVNQFEYSNHLEHTGDEK